jgi:hypothetical protein
MKIVPTLIALVVSLGSRVYSQPATASPEFGRQTTADSWNDFDPVTALCRLTLQSSPGDFVGKGMSYSYDNLNGDIFIVRADLSDDGSYLGKPVSSIEIRFYRQFQLGFWRLVFRTNQLDPMNLIGLSPGFYAGAQRAEFTDPGHPGIDVGGTHNGGSYGRGCNVCYGSFNVYDAKFDYTTVPVRVLSFAVEFEQRCESEMAPPLRGKFEYNFIPGRRRAVVH